MVSIVFNLFFLFKVTSAIKEVKLEPVSFKNKHKYTRKSCFYDFFTIFFWNFRWSPLSKK